jgi:HlyD family secretion protein
MSAILNPLPQQPVPPPQTPAPVVTPPESSPSRGWMWLLVLAAIGGVVAWQLKTRSAEQAGQATTGLVRTAAVTQGSLSISMRVAGQTSARDYANIMVPRMTGPESNRPLMLEKLAKPGTVASTGNMVAQIDAQSMLDHIDDVHSTVLQAESDVKKRVAEQSIEMGNVRQTVKMAEAAFSKMRIDAGAAPVRTPIDQELLKLSADEAQANFEELRTDVRNKLQSQGAELEVLKLTLLRHERHRDRHKRDAERFKIIAPMEGLIVMQSIFMGSEFRQIQEGDQVFSGQSIMKLVSPKSMQVEASVSQADSERFRVGQKATIGLDAFPGLKFDGVIDTMGAIAVPGARSSSNYLRSVPVRIKILGSDQRLIPDLSASADVVLESHANQTLVPRAALVDEGGKMFVYVKKGENRFERRPVAVSQTNYNQAAILSGVNAGEEVALNYVPPVVAQ